ncbi:MAG: aromatic ring-hydroxylating dioxygenase subunit alpha [Cyanobacteria bacterium]|nr:aromatic ring-hydroxylating dioxygenase subunit alpha [Cyanobacteriota bacterium]
MIERETTCDASRKLEDAVETLPASWYCDSSVYQAERENLFRRSWIYVAHESELSREGDYITFEVAGYPLFLTRKADGKISAFHNVCRHRAAPLLSETSGSLSGSTISCRYHGWTYNTDGQLQGAPYFDCSDSCQKEELSLFPVAVSTYEGLIFVNLADNSAPLSEQHSQLFDTIASSDCDLSDYTYHSKMVREGAFNWKVWIEGYQECYHCPTIHPIFLRDFALQKYSIENRRLFSLHNCERRVESASGTFKGLWLWVYPNLGMPVYEPAFYTLQVNPLAVDRTRLTYTFHFRDTENEKNIADFLEFVDKITEEDVTVCEAVQRNLEVGVFKRGFLNPSRENGVIYFHSLVRQALNGTECGATITSLKNNNAEREVLCNA